MKALALVALVGCGFTGGATGDDQPSPDAPDPDAPIVVGDPDGPTDAAPNDPTPALIPGGGITDGPISGVVHVHVFDTVTRAVIADATVAVAAVEGMTDATGLFSARSATLSGKQTILVTKAGYRASQWVGVDGANVTIGIEPLAPVPRGTISGSFPGISSGLGGGHYRFGFVSYSSDDAAGGNANDLGGVLCNTIQHGSACAWTATSRTGTVALGGQVFDIDTHNTMSTSDDDVTFETFAVRSSVTVTNGQNTPNMALTLIPRNELVTGSVTFAQAPTAFTTVSGYVGIEVPNQGVVYLSTEATRGAPSLRTVSPAVFGAGSTYRFISVGGSGMGGPTNGVTLQRHVTGTAFTSPAWMEPPVNLVLARTEVGWDATPGAAYVSAELGSALAIVVFDGSTQVALPAAVILPAGPIDVTVAAVGATLDVTNFGFDADRDTITASSERRGQIP